MCIRDRDNLVGYNLDGIKKKMTARQLENGMFFVVTAPAKEIDVYKRQGERHAAERTCGLIFCVYDISVAWDRQQCAGTFDQCGNHGTDTGIAA